MRVRTHVVFLTALLAAINLCSPGHAQEPEIPPSVDYISDYAEVVDQATEEELRGLIAELEEETGARIMVLTVGSIGPLEISDYGSRVTDEWGLGPRDALFIVALEDGGVYLDTGKRLQKILPDERLQEILDRQILPSFNQGDFSGGVYQGVEAMASAISESLPQGWAIPLPLLIAISLGALAVIAIVLL